MSYLNEGNMNLWVVDQAVRSSVSLLVIEQVRAPEPHPGMWEIWIDIIPVCKATDL